MTGAAAQRPESRVAWVCAGGAAAISLVALGGWTTEHLGLASVSDAFVPMAPNTALAFLALALSLALRTRPDGARGSTLAAFAGAGVVALAVVTLLEGAGVLQAIDVDQVLIEGRARVGTLQIGRMSLYTAATLVPIGIALATRARTPRQRAVRNALASLSALVGTLFSLGYALGAPLLYATASVPLALPTSLAFVLVGAGTLALPPRDAWPVQLVVGESVRARLLRAFVPLVIVVVVAQGWLASLAGRMSAVSTALLASGAVLLGGTLVGRVAVSIAKRIEEAQQQAADAQAALYLAHEQLARAQKMEAIGRLAGGVAHDFNNMLSVILSQSELLLARRGTTGPDAEALDEIRQAAERSARLSQQLLAVSRHQVLAPVVLDLDGLTRSMAELLQSVAGEAINVCTRLGAGPARVRADPAQLEQVLLNLVVNARDAMPAGGTIVIETRSDDESVVLVVRDTGTGIEPETLPHIFEPFFATKSEVQGSGLGLSIVHGIVEQSGGRISVTSVADRGTEFRVRFPVATPAPVSLASPPVPRATGGDGSKTVLLVEDEALVRRAARRILVSAGYRVLEAGDATTALDTARGYAGSIDAVVSDVMMPGMDGTELLEVLAQEFPGIGRVLMSGFTSEAISGTVTRRRNTGFVQKPFTSDTLLAAVNGSLARR